jgi:hypothetical protein
MFVVIILQRKKRSGKQNLLHDFIYFHVFQKQKLKSFIFSQFIITKNKLFKADRLREL